MNAADPDPTAEALLSTARQAADRAYCPYSHFPVGAAVEAADGRVFTGCNIENASYGLTICAERVAIFQAIAAGAAPLVRIAVRCVNGDAGCRETLMPCGACRQVMREFMEPEAEVFIDGAGVFRLGDLLPDAFHL